MKDDFPAAHSMDTTWFAVDGKGNIASFASGEAGALPYDARADGDVGIGTWMVQLINESEYELLLDDLLVESDDKLYQGRYWPEIKYDPVGSIDSSRTIAYSVLFWLKDRNGFEELSRKAESELIRVKHPSEVLGWVPEMNPAAVHRLVRSNSVKKVWVDFEFSFERMGWYSYSHGDAFENWISGPYLKESSPNKPMKLSQLPAKFQEQLSTVEFERLDFEKDRMFHPVDHKLCNSWGSRYVDANGEVRDIQDAPIPPGVSEDES